MPVRMCVFEARLGGLVCHFLKKMIATDVTTSY